MARVFFGAGALSIVIAGVLAAPGAAQIVTPEVPDPATPEPAPVVGPEPAAEPKPSGSSRAEAAATPSKLNVHLGNLRSRKLDVGEKIRVSGFLTPWRSNQKVRVLIFRKGKRFAKRDVKVRQVGKKNYGRYTYRKRLIKPGRHRVRVVHRESGKLRRSEASTAAFRIRYPSLNQGDRGKQVRILKNLLDDRGYVPGGGKTFNSRTARAILAYRKVNKLSRSSTKATKSIFRKLAAGRGGFKVKSPELGHHAEVDLSRQVLVLAKGRKVRRIYHVSTGAPSTPTVRGKFTFHRTEPGYNNKNMYYSWYFYGGYAIHGYASVPTYPASHGCVRTPISDAVSIYKWIEYGDKIHVYK